ncbi:cyclin-dependent kinase G1 isoform X1 [Arachis hypogaea]|uniref:cyclin-dependent kinase G1 isoform X1 n=1 Tax=Arachis hypogaea TaxID=3818 RepID=UPI000DECF1E3|nr:cell division control protein 2 homolog B isoform X1 [Arachis hypogaea]XP_025603415.1 cell division control protein 2 homolog B isoform X1 [Arachis hypogaea]QHO45647.1 Cyclin-dependent kinase [Arachis hypogaea]
MFVRLLCSALWRSHGFRHAPSSYLALCGALVTPVAPPQNLALWLLSKEPLFNGKTEFDQLDKIFKILGTPSEIIWLGFSKLPGVKVNFVKHQLPTLGGFDLAIWPLLMICPISKLFADHGYSCSQS